MGTKDSYNYATGQPYDSRNKECLLIDHSHASESVGANVNTGTNPVISPWGGQANSIPYNLISEILRNKQGENVTMPMTGTFPQMKALYRQIEDRFHTIAWVPGWAFTRTGQAGAENGDTAKFMYRVNGLGGSPTRAGSGNLVTEPRGFFSHKFTFFSTTGTQQYYWPIYRLAEFYLNYAEALNENDPNNIEIVNALNKIRTRGGLPLLQPGNSTYNLCFGKKDEMRKYIQQERAIELYGEEHRWFDLRRWRMITPKLNSKFYSIVLYENGTGTYVNPSSTWTPSQRLANDSKLSYVIVEYETRFFYDKMYFYPFDQSEVNKGFIIQNPGW